MRLFKLEPRNYSDRNQLCGGLMFWNFFFSFRFPSPKNISNLGSVICDVIVLILRFDILVMFLTLKYFYFNRDSFSKEVDSFNYIN